MTSDELIRFIDGPLAAYLMPNGVTYGRFIEMIREEFPDLEIRYQWLYPRLFNLEARPINGSDLAWDIEAIGRDYIHKINEKYKE